MCISPIAVCDKKRKHVKTVFPTKNAIELQEHLFCEEEKSTGEHDASFSEFGGIEIASCSEFGGIRAAPWKTTKYNLEYYYDEEDTLNTIRRLAG